MVLQSNTIQLASTGSPECRRPLVQSDFTIRFLVKFADVNRSTNDREDDCMKTFPNTPVMIVDDMKLARLRLRKICEAMAFNPIWEAGSGKEAWDLIQKKTAAPVLILSDYNMPEMNGMEFLEKVRNNPDTEDTPVVFITSEGEREKIVAAVSMGVTAYVVKPFSDEVMADKIQYVMGKVK